MSLRHGLVVQFEVVHALILRETRTRYGDSDLGYVWAFIQPMIQVGFFAFMMILGRVRDSSGMDIFGFLITGILGYDMVTNGLERAINAVGGNQSLLLYPQVKVLDVVIARVVLEALTTMAVFAVFMTADSLFVGRFHVDEPITVLLGLLLGGWLGGGLGMIFCALNVFSSGADKLRAIVMRPLFFVSGVFYTANGLPIAFQDVLVFNPVLHVIEMVRSGWYGSYQSQVADPVYLTGWCVVTTALGLLLEQAARSRVEVS